MKQKLNIEELHNEYYVQRHEESVPNKLGIIVSDPKRGKMRVFGLTKFGKLHARVVAEINECALGSDTLIVSSPSSRTKDTAKITAKIWRIQTIRISHHLRERFFGIYEGMENTNYQKVWDDDEKNPDHQNHGGESVHDVEKRIRSLVAKLENDYTGKKILLVTHGDTGQIAQCFFKGVDARYHRTLKHLETGEIRKLSL